MHCFVEVLMHMPLEVSREFGEAFRRDALKARLDLTEEVAQLPAELGISFHHLAPSSQLISDRNGLLDNT